MFLLFACLLMREHKTSSPESIYMFLATENEEALAMAVHIWLYFSTPHHTSHPLTTSTCTVHSQLTHSWTAKINPQIQERQSQPQATTISIQHLGPKPAEASYTNGHTSSLHHHQSLTNITDLASTPTQNSTNATQPFTFGIHSTLAISLPYMGHNPFSNPFILQESLVEVKQIGTTLKHLWYAFVTKTRFSWVSLASIF